MSGILQMLVAAGDNSPILSSAVGTQAFGTVTLVPTVGTGTDLLLAVVMQSNGASVATWTNDGGYTERVDFGNSPGTPPNYCIATHAGNTTSVIFTVTTNDNKSGIVLTSRTYPTYDTIGNAPAVASPSTTVTLPSVTVASNGSLALAIFVRSAASSFTTPSGWTLYSSAGTDPEISIFYKRVDAGATGTVVSDSSSTTGTAGGSLVILGP